ncbi:MAG: hypothetical protein IJY47_02165 [Clostridia bacterium]|nr:hypothetical protein [Clostridia bacterium]
METVKRKRWWWLVLLLALCLSGCRGSLRAEDIRPFGFFAEVVIHREDQAERVRITVGADNGELRDLLVEWISPESLAGLTLRRQAGKWQAEWEGMVTEGEYLAAGVSFLDVFLGEGEWKPVARTTYRGRDAIYVCLRGEEQEIQIYMDGKGSVPLGIILGETELEFLSFEKAEG